MLYQEINLPDWALLLLMLFIAWLVVKLIKIEPKAEPREFLEDRAEKLPPDPLQARYGAYIQSRGRYYN